MKREDLPASFSEQKAAEFEARRARVHEMGPDALEFVRNMTDAGLIKGWRSLLGVYGPGERSPDEKRAVVASPYGSFAFCKPDENEEKDTKGRKR